MTEQLTRRGFTTKTLGTLLTYTLLEDLANQDLFAAEVKPITKAKTKAISDRQKTKAKPLRPFGLRIEWAGFLPAAGKANMTSKAKKTYEDKSSLAILTCRISCKEKSRN